jgi:hypothetical protein
MGYTHYWNTKGAMSESEWEAITAAARKIIAKSTVALAFEYDEPEKKIVISKTAIRFNGIGDDGHETFCIGPDGTDFEFCKTARKPYDEVVVAILQACAVYASRFSWSSDGTREEHADGITLYNAATGANWDYSNVTEEQS